MIFLQMLPTKQAGTEGLFTHVALEGLHVEVDDGVADQAAIGGEGGVAHVTLEGFYSCQAGEFKQRHKQIDRDGDRK